MQAPVTHATFNATLPTMKKGDQLIYHVGSLMFDRLCGPLFQTTHGAALAAYAAYQRGEVHLVQRKISALCFEYIAIRR